MIPSVRLMHGDCREIIATLDDESVASIVTDPPYELGFMGKKWDNSGIAYDVQLWTECLRVLKPGGHLLAFGGTRTYHRMASAIEDAGFEIRDSIHWLYGSGFPKSHDVSKAIDKRGGYPNLAAEIGAALKSARERRGISVGQADKMFCGGTTNWTWFEGRPRGQRAPTPDTFANIVSAWPEMATLAEKVAEAEREIIGTKSSGIANKDEGPRHTIGASQAVVVDITAPATDAAKQWQGWGTALKPAHEPIVVARKPLIGTVAANVQQHGTGALNIDSARIGDGQITINTFDNGAKPFGGAVGEPYTSRQSAGRWPANVITDGSIEAEWVRYFYCAKPSKRERNAGLEALPNRDVHRFGAGIGEGTDPKAPSIEGNFHPTVKPLALMRYLVRLVTPPGGTVLEPFAGSGTTLAAAILEGFDAIGCELTDDYLPIIEGRIAWAQQERAKANDSLFGDVA
jgi:site-specific DNA-methyltransferase (adenine-specific)